MYTKELIEVAKSFAKKLLEDYNEFYPFAFGKSQKGEIVSISTQMGNDFPSSSDLKEELKTALTSSNTDNNFSVVCITSDVRVMPIGYNTTHDAIQITLNFNNGIAIHNYVTYSLTDNELTYGISWSEISDESIIFPQKNLKNKIFTLKRIIEKQSPIVYVAHDENDQWQFLDGAPASIDDLSLTDLPFILKLEPSALEIFDLNTGFEAKRKYPSINWKRFKSE